MDLVRVPIHTCDFCFLVYGIVKLKVLTRKMAISARVIERLGQYSMGVLLQPEVMPSLYNCSTQSAAQYVSETSSKMPVAGSGM